MQVGDVAYSASATSYGAKPSDTYYARTSGGGTVTQAEFDIFAINTTEDLATINQDLSGINSDVSALTVDVSALTVDVSGLKVAVAKNTLDISGLKVAVAKNTADITVLNKHVPRFIQSGYSGIDLSSTPQIFCSASTGNNYDPSSRNMDPNLYAYGFATVSVSLQWRNEDPNPEPSGGIIVVIYMQANIGSNSQYITTNCIQTIQKKGDYQIISLCGYIVNLNSPTPAPLTISAYASTPFNNLVKVISGQLNVNWYYS